MTTPQTKNAPAGIVLTPGIDDVLERIEQEEDFARDRRALLDGVPLTPAELEEFRAIFTVVQREANRHLLSHGVVLGACGVNPRGFGAVFMGIDREGRSYDVTLGPIPPEVRLAKQALGQESFVRWMIDIVAGEVVAQKRRYLERGGLSS
ncbi:MAG TPA: hypothetical protein VM686_00315 [Polyangiaceae bacterium]|nr:hypothetical protein [Polyangiaceae bacterium]